MTLGSTLSIWLITTLLGLIAFPLVFLICPRLRDRGYASSKIISLVLITYFAWLFSSLRLIPFGTTSVVIGVLIVGSVSAWIAWWKRAELAEYLKANARYLAGFELIFFLSFLLFLLIVSLNPDINPDSERFMDYALLNSIDRTDYFPPLDPWLSGKTMNYYYYGYIIVAALHQLAKIPLPIFFNPALALVYSLFTLTCFGIGYNLTGKKSYGWLAAGALMFIGNLDGFIQIVQGKYALFDFFHGARVLVQEAPDGRILDYPINEFPFFSLMWGDLHAYVIAYPINLAILNLVLNLALSGGGGKMFGEKLPERIVTFAVLSLTLGALFGTNTWDYPIYLAVTSGVVAINHWKAEGKTGAKISIVIFLVILIFLSSFIPYLPFNWDFLKEQRAQGRGGIGLVSRRSPLGLFLVAFGIYLFFLVAYLTMQARSAGAKSGKRILRGPFLMFLAAALIVIIASGPQTILGETYVFLFLLILLLLLILFSPERLPEENFSLILVLAALSLAALCEFVFLRDHYQGGGYERMNTVFKIYVHVWLFLGVAAVYFISFINRQLRPREGPRLIWQTLVFIVLFLGFFYTIGSLGSRIRGRPHPLTLDGVAYIEKPVPSWQKEEWKWDRDDWEAIGWMQHNIPGRPVILEAADNAYHWASRVATFTGFPTLVGWVNHEAGWRNDWKEPGDRSRDVATIYGTANANLALYLINKYGIRYVYIGNLERGRYSKEGLDKFAKLGQKVYSQGPVEIFRVGK